MTVLEGSVGKIMFHADDFWVFEFMSACNPLKRVQSQTVSGSLFGLNAVPGMCFRLLGSWVQHPKFGLQFSPESWEPWAPDIMKARDFLCYGVFCERKVARLLTDGLKDKTLEVLGAIKEKPLDLSTFGVTPEEKQDLLDFQLTWERLLGKRDFARVLSLGGFSTWEVNSAFFKYGGELHKIRDNPYLLAAIPGVKFAKLDILAARLDVPDVDRKRLQGGILWALQDGLNEGHLYLDRPALEDFLSKSRIDYLVAEGGLKEAIRALVEQGACVHDPSAGVYLASNFDAEDQSAKLLAERAKDHVLEGVDLDKFIASYEAAHQIELSVEQRKAVEHMVQHRVLVITGLPGTGKTASVRALIRLLEEYRVSFHLMAPTGIAAKRLSDVTGHKAMTIHRTLAYNGVTWGHTRDNKFVVDAVVVDEMSMVDQGLLFQLLDALPENTRVILVGDDAQLPSVGAGNVLRELAQCPAIPTVRLTKIFRQAAQSAIVRSSHAIHQGVTPELPGFKDESDFKFVPLSDESKMVDLIVKMAKKLKSQDANFQVLSPKYAGDIGVDNLNLALRDAINPEEGPRSVWSGKNLDLRVGDRVMVLVNDYQKNVYNGDVGKVLQIVRSGGRKGESGVLVKIFGAGIEGTDLEVLFQEGEIEQKLKLAFAVTVHKCVAPETLVSVAEGEVTFIKDIPFSGQILTPSGFKPYQNLVLRDPGPMLRFWFDDGRSLGVTPDHGLDVYLSRGWTRVEARHVMQGDWLRTPLPEAPVLGRWGSTSKAGHVDGPWLTTRVASREHYEGPSVCVEVPDGHQFLQNGFCGWNCQGQEFDIIILPLSRSQGIMLQRNLLYTAVTRAKKQVWLIGDQSALDKAVANNQVVFRRTKLNQRISSYVASAP
jgi:exodeoxyribonuclease V alpha subunit